MLSELAARPLLLALVAASSLQFVVALLVGRAKRAAVAPARGPDRYVDADAGRVVCPACEAVNALGYRFCRSCVRELPGAVDRSRGTGGPARTFG